MAAPAVPQSVPAPPARRVTFLFEEDHHPCRRARRPTDWLAGCLLGEALGCPPLLVDRFDSSSQPHAQPNHKTGRIIMSRPEKQNPPQLHYNETVRLCVAAFSRLAARFRSRREHAWMDGQGLVSRSVDRSTPCGSLDRSIKPGRPCAAAVVVLCFPSDRIQCLVIITITTQHPSHIITGGAQVPQQLAHRGGAERDHRAVPGAAGARGVYLYMCVERWMLRRRYGTRWTPCC